MSYLLDKEDRGPIGCTFAVDFDKIKGAVRDLDHDLLTVEATAITRRKTNADDLACYDAVQKAQAGLTDIRRHRADFRDGGRAWEVRAVRNGARQQADVAWSECNITPGPLLTVAVLKAAAGSLQLGGSISRCRCRSLRPPAP